jgi:hypothetical protein
MVGPGDGAAPTRRASSGLAWPGLAACRTVPIALAGIGPPLLHHAQRAGYQVGLLPRDFHDRCPQFLVDPSHPPPEERVQPGRNQRRLMRPVLDQPQAHCPISRTVSLIAVPGNAIERGTVIAAETGEQGQVVRPAKDVDRVELHQAEAANGCDEIILGRRSRGTGLPEPLGGEGDPPGGRLAQVLRGRRHLRPAPARSGGAVHPAKLSGPGAGPSGSGPASTRGRGCR